MSENYGTKDSLQIFFKNCSKARYSILRWVNQNDLNRYSKTWLKRGNLKVHFSEHFRCPIRNVFQLRKISEFTQNWAELEICSFDHLSGYLRVCLKISKRNRIPLSETNSFYSDTKNLGIIINSTDMKVARMWNYLCDKFIHLKKLKIKIPITSVEID